MLIDKTRHTTPYYIYSLSQYSELIQEYQEDKDWTHKLDQEKVDIENLSLQGSPVGEFILHHLLWYIPSQEQTGKETCCRQEQLTRYEVEPVEQGLATERQLICSPQRKRTECTNDGTRYRNNHGTPSFCQSLTPHRRKKYSPREATSEMSMLPQKEVHRTSRR